MKNTHLLTHIKRHQVNLAILSLILIGNGLFLQFNAFRGFNFFDMGAFMDSSWRIFNGQLPYIDFHFLTGPVHLYLSLFFYALFGFSKLGVLMHLLTIHSIVIVLTFLMARRFTPRWTSCLVTLLTMTCFYWPVSHPWYDQSAHFFGIIGLSAIIFTYPFQNRRAAFWTGVLTGVMAILSFMTKANIGFAYGALFGLFFLVSHYKLDSLKGYSLGLLVALAFLLILIRSPVDFIEQTRQYVGSAAQIRKRFWSFYWIINWWREFYLLGLLVTIITIEQSIKKQKPLIILLVGLYFLVIFTKYTGSMKAESNIPMSGIFFLFCFALIFNDLPNCHNRFQTFMHRFSIGVLTLITIFLTFNAAKLGLALDAWSYGGIEAKGTYALKQAPLKGWLVDRDEGEAIDHLADFINQHVPKEESLLVLTDLQILYLLTKRDSYRNISFQFSTQNQPAPGKMRDKVSSHILSNPPDWIVTHMSKPRTEFAVYIISYLGLVDMIQHQYYVETEINHYALLRHRKFQ